MCVYGDDVLTLSLFVAPITDNFSSNAVTRQNTPSISCCSGSFCQVLELIVTHQLRVCPTQFCGIQQSLLGVFVCPSHAKTHSSQKRNNTSSQCKLKIQKRPSCDSAKKLLLLWAECHYPRWPNIKSRLPGAHSVQPQYWFICIDRPQCVESWPLN